MNCWTSKHNQYKGELNFMSLLGLILYSIPAVIICTKNFSFSTFTAMMAIIPGFIGSLLITLDILYILNTVKPFECLKKHTVSRKIIIVLSTLTLQTIVFTVFHFLPPITSILLLLSPFLLFVGFAIISLSSKNQQKIPKQLSPTEFSHTIPNKVPQKEAIVSKEVLTTPTIEKISSNYKKIDDAIQKENEIKIKTTQSIKEMRKQSDKEISSLVKYTFIAGVIAILIFSFLVWKFFQGAILFKNSLLICTFFILPICTFCLGSSIQKEEKAFEIYEKTSNAEAEKEIFINYAKLISDIRATSIYEFCGIPSNVSLDEEGLPRDNLFSELKYGSFTRYHTNAECFHRVRGCSDAYDVTYLYDARFRACRKCAYEDIDIIPPKWFVYAQKLTTICKKYPEAFEHVLTQRKENLKCRNE